MRNPGLLAGIALLTLTVGTFATPPGAAPPAQSAGKTPMRYWPQWRGPIGTGEAPSAKPPIEWSEQKNVRWKVAVPGEGKSTPVVWDNMLFLTTSVPAAGVAPVPPTAADSSGSAGPQGRSPVRTPPGEVEFVVLALQRDNGSVRWRTVVRKEVPHEGHHQDGTYASASALTDGSRVYAFFGSRGLYALDMNGKLVWEKQLGRMQTRNGFGEASSAALHGETLVVNWDHEGEDFIAAFDAKTGREKWRQARDEPTTWTTPLVTVHDGKAHVVVSGTNRIVSYDLDTGQPLWQAQGLTANVIPTPVSAQGIVYAMSGFRGNALRAIRLGKARGVVSGPPAVAWTYDRDTPYVPSPLLYRDELYFLKSNSGVLTCLDAKTGELRYTQRLETVPNVYASPVAADGRVYILGRDGSAAVLAAGPTLRVMATSKLDDDFDASPVAVDVDLYLRGARHLYRITAS